MFNLKHSFGPGDVTCIAMLPGKSYVIDEVTNFSISTHFDKIPIRRLGHRLGVGWATGGGTIAGTFVMAQFTAGALWKVRRHAGAVRLFQDEPYLFDNPLDTGHSHAIDAKIDAYTASILPQQLPPFHMLFVHQNQNAQMGVARLYNITFSDMGEVKGTENAFTEETLQYQALYYEQIKLQRSLSTDQMAQLVGKEVGYFNDPRGNSQLVDDIIQVGGVEHITNMADLAVEETAGVLTRYAEGGVTSIGIADRGNVAFLNPDEIQMVSDQIREAASLSLLKLEESGKTVETLTGTDDDELDRKELQFSALGTELVPFNDTEEEHPVFFMVRDNELHINSDPDDPFTVTSPIHNDEVTLTMRTYIEEALGLEWKGLPAPCASEVTFTINREEETVTREPHRTPAPFELVSKGYPVETHYEFTGTGYVHEEIVVRDGTIETGFIGPQDTSGRGIAEGGEYEYGPTGEIVLRKTDQSMVTIKEWIPDATLVEDSDTRFAGQGPIRWGEDWAEFHIDLDKETGVLDVTLITPYETFTGTTDHPDGRFDGQPAQSVQDDPDNGYWIELAPGLFIQGGKVQDDPPEGAYAEFYLIFEPYYQTVLDESYTSVELTDRIFEGAHRGIALTATTNPDTDEIETFTWNGAVRTLTPVEHDDTSYGYRFPAQEGDGHAGSQMFFDPGTEQLLFTWTKRSFS